VRDYFNKVVDKLGLSGVNTIRIIYHTDINNYFDEFSRLLHNTDILWTKPSELSFYCGLGIPIIIAPAIGPHEVFNLRWIREIDGGVRQEDPKYCREWITDYLVDGRFAQAAWDGFLHARKMGTYKIHDVLTTGSMEKEASPFKR